MNTEELRDEFARLIQEQLDANGDTAALRINPVIMDGNPAYLKFYLARGAEDRFDEFDVFHNITDPVSVPPYSSWGIPTL